MTHEYTLLLGGHVLADAVAPHVQALAWAGDTILALGSDEEIRAISRGDSRMIDLDGAFVVPIGPRDEPFWPPRGRLEVGGPADLAVLRRDPRQPAATEGGAQVAAIVRGGRVVSGMLERRPGDQPPGFQISRS